MLLFWRVVVGCCIFYDNVVGCGCVLLSRCHCLLAQRVVDSCVCMLLLGVVLCAMLCVLLLLLVVW